MCLCAASAATSAKECVDAESESGIMGIRFHPRFQDGEGYFLLTMFVFRLCFPPAHNNEANTKVAVNPDAGGIPVQAEVAFRSVSDLEPHVKGAKT